MEIPEIWCYDTGNLKIYQLQNGEYRETETSLVFSRLAVKEIPGIIEQNRTGGRHAIRQAVRAWARTQLKL